MLAIYGASDDLVEVEGDVREEWGVGDNDQRLVATSTGHVFRVRFGDDGWEVRLLAGDPRSVLIRKNTEREDDDVAELSLPVAWVLCADRLERSRTIQPNPT